jgi:hypothetical protein
MNNRENGFREYKQERRASLKWGVWSILALVLLLACVSLFYLMSAPSRVLNRTMQTDNIIQSYEWFHDTHNSFMARVAQIKSHQRAMKLAGDDADRQDRYRIEVEAMRQSCRDMAARYNANSTKINKSIFKGRTAPARLNLSECEASS